eukprot:CAMPEP_0197915062 /NCGR_PEP_ID=MMETSP1439-20131203/79564_1 /TAXON_ID=66791 /ORGANISM="Gonyaulax spinifera, Strain CCMP409" /LENGTH=238 /DNA_ID=CAMNT_0043536999 /DNA_START=92 /DNA_END=804 /DNA_ORIENTATION=+
MPELLNRLAEREKARFAAGQEATSRIRAAELQTTRAAEKLMELRRAQDQELKVLKAQFEKRLRDTTYAARQAVARTNKELWEAQAVADQAVKRQRSAEESVACLKQKLKHLREYAQRRTDGAKASRTMLQNMMDSRLKRVAAQSDARVENMTAHAKEVSALSNVAMDTVNTELQSQLAHAHVRAEGRVRFKELCQLAHTFGNYDMSKDAYYHVKHELIDLWHAQKATPFRLTQTAPAG